MTKDGFNRQITRQNGKALLFWVFFGLTGLTALLAFGVSKSRAIIEERASGNAKNSAVVKNENGNVKVTNLPSSGETDKKVSRSNEDCASSSSSSSSGGNGQVGGGLIADYSFDEGQGVNLEDLSGNGRDGELYETVWVNGNNGSALRFDNHYDYVEVPMPEDLEEFSVSVWFKREDGGSNNDSDTLFSYFKNAETPSGQEGFELGFYWNDPENLSFIVTTANGEGVRKSQRINKARGNLSEGWHHAVAIFDSEEGEQILYIDGVAVERKSHPAGNKFVPLAEDEAAIGARPGGGGGYFIGSIDDVKIYDRVISEEEAESLYENGHSF
ncbi:LamG domain-containing protein [Candidatus Parcubacteria bacterium]|nr:MAG: LamG domain-containing protein [Candidatus Parcubacteria bacterium]